MEKAFSNELSKQFQMLIKEVMSICDMQMTCEVTAVLLRVKKSLKSEKILLRVKNPQQCENRHLQSSTL